MADKLTGPSALALLQSMDGPALWRVLQPITALEKLGYPAGWDLKDAPLLGLVARAAEVIILPRISWPPEYRRVAEAWFAECRAKGQTVVYECDDDVFTSASTQRRVELSWTYGKSYEQLEAARFEGIWAMQQCDGVTVSTQRLATIVRSYTNKPVIVVPNAIDLPWFRGIVRATKRQIPGLTIGWAGGRRHDRDVELMAKAWGRIAERYPEVRFVVQGHQPAVIAEHVPGHRVVQLPWMPLETYPAGLAQIDIGCCAVADTPFNRAKSQIKVMEAAAAGSAVVASPFYEGLVEHEVSGYVAATAGEWEWALRSLIERTAQRSMTQHRLMKKIEKHHSLAGNLWRWPAAWSLIAESARNRSALILA